MKVTSDSVAETREFGARIARRARRGDTYALIGDLGAGKTEFVRGFVAALNPDAVVRSPSFTLVNIYETALFPIYHFDFYRLVEAGELVEIGLDEYLRGDGICLIEWADRFPDQIPDENRRRIWFHDEGEMTRIIEIGED